MSAETLLTRLHAWSIEQPDSIAQYEKKYGQWQSITAQQYWQNVVALACFFYQKNFSPQDILTILSYNCAAWVTAELSALLLGGKSAGIYPNIVGKDIFYILQHTESRFFVVQNESYFEKLGEFKNQVLDQVSCILVFEGSTKFSAKAIGYSDAIQEGLQGVNAQQIQQWINAIQPKNPAFIIYTSGTTGTPKGAMLSHHNLVFTIDQVKEHWCLPDAATVFSFLPLCHIAEKLQCIAAAISFRYATYFCSNFDRLAEELPQVQPSLLLCVPRVWEKMMEGVFNKATKMPRLQQMLLEYAFRLANKKVDYLLRSESLPLLEELKWEFFHQTLFKKIKTSLGLKNAKVAACGAGGLPAHVWKFFRGLGIEIQEDFGQSESSGVICMTKPGIPSVGLTGFPVHAVEVKIAEDAEIYTRGEHVFCGYFKETSLDYLDTEGWLKTGDLGKWEANGQLRIIGRKKDIIKTSGGKIIAPVPIEEKLKVSTLISQACLVGDKRKFPSVLIVPSTQFLDQLAKENIVVDRTNLTIEQPIVYTRIKNEIDRVNKQLSHYEQIKKFAILTNEFSIARGEMTPTLKLKRHIIETNYQAVINAFYTD